MAKTARKGQPAAKKKTSAPHDIVLNVLGYREEGDWVALALEMDLRGYAATIDEALTELADLVATQMSFARFKRQPEMISKPAEPVYWRLFETAVLDHLRDLALDSAPSNPEYKARSLPLPPAHVIAELCDFREANA